MARAPRVIHRRQPAVQPPAGWLARWLNDGVPFVRRVGGMRLVRFGRLQVSICRVRPASARTD